MERLVQLEQACKNNDHELLKDILDSFDSNDLKKETFLRIINYYENIESRFPVGYYKLFIKWLSGNGDFETASKYIGKIARMNAGQTPELIYELVIKPDELRFREKFDKNLEILRKNRALISTHSFYFAHAINNISKIKNCHTDLDTGTANMIKEKKVNIMAIDIMDLEKIQHILKEGRLVFLVYDDLKIFYSVLLFEDMTLIEQYAGKGKIVVFSGRDMESLKLFFSNLKVDRPFYFLAPHRILKEYKKTIDEITELKCNTTLFYIKELESYYKNMDFEYYKNLFNKGPANIKVMLITSEHTDLNKFITKNWYEAFLESGYSARLLIESELYETISNLYIIEQMYEYKPDIVFQINHSVDECFGEKDDIKKNLLWIMRYRDEVGIPHIDSNSNMFVLPMTDTFDTHGMPENRLFTVPDGVNINLFSKKGKINSEYDCDITCVNNSGGGEASKLEYYVNNLPNEHAREVLYGLYNELIENFDDEHVFFPVDFKSFIDKKMQNLGIQMPDSGKQYLRVFAAQIMETHYRGKVIEWIIESNITHNIKLWGKHWSNVDKFKNYHLGIAQHGNELASIYENSRISISDVLLMHEKNFEILAGGGFPLIRYKKFPEGTKIRKITDFFKEDNEVVVFYSKDDLLNKIQYYLDNPEERERIAENGRDVVLRDFSNIAVAKRTMDFIKNYYSDETNVNQGK